MSLACTTPEMRTNGFNIRVCSFWYMQKVYVWCTVIPYSLPLGDMSMNAFLDDMVMVRT